MFSRKFFDSVLFDLDGTLIESLDALFDVYKNFLLSYEVEGTRMEFEDLNGPSLSEIVDTLAKRHRLTRDVDELYQQYVHAICQTYERDVELRSGARELLSRCKQLNFQLALVTSGPAVVAEQLLVRTRLKTYFEAVVTGDTVSASKPNPEIYMQALQKMRCPASRAIAIEDSPSGVKAAVLCGIATIAVSAEKSHKLLESGAQLVVSDLHQASNYFSA